MRNRLRAIGIPAGVISLFTGIVIVLPGSAGATVPAEEWSTHGRFVGADYAPAGQVVSNVRGTSRQVVAGPDYDRLVVDTISAKRSGRVGLLARYVPQVSQDGSGDVLPLDGAAKLELVVKAPAYNEAGQTTYQASVRRDLPGVSDGRRVVDTVYGGSFEGRTTFGIGLNSKRPFRVQLLGDGRIVIDFQH